VWVRNGLCRGKLRVCLQMKEQGSVPYLLSEASSPLETCRFLPRQWYMCKEHSFIIVTSPLLHTFRITRDRFIVSFVFQAFSVLRVLFVNVLSRICFGLFRTCSFECYRSCVQSYCSGPLKMKLLV
jgi:hypothetical protein